MQPQTASDQYAPKWRHFHPQSTVWILNPFDHEVIFHVADENNRKSSFRIGPRERAELPGGPIATLGVKAIIDELIQNSKEDILSLYVASVRKKYEEQVILRVKEAPAAVTTDPEKGTVDLSIGEDPKAKKEEKKVEEKKPFAEVPKNPKYAKKKAESKKEVQAVKED